ncbi:MAG: hypothetical protein IH577_04510 [Deltaproteobacteria bacterium]|nr:hypothetical protein [Deltaproteobacteria bacterium]
MRTIEQLKSWYHRHIVADAETSRLLAEIDEGLDQREMELRILLHLKPLRRQCRAEEFGEQIREIEGRG